MQKYIIEFIGTFFLVLTIGLVFIGSEAGAFAPLAVGSVLTAMIYAGGPISGAHYNPAVTIAFMLRGRCEFKSAIMYIIIQLLAALAAAIMVGILRAGVVVTAAPIDLTQAFFAEVIFTFALVFVILSVATSIKAKGNGYFGLAIGFTVMGAIYTVGNISGAVLNPAVCVGVIIMGLAELSSVFMYLVSQIVGAVLAVWAFQLTNPAE